MGDDPGTVDEQNNIPLSGGNYDGEEGANSGNDAEPEAKPAEMEEPALNEVLQTDVVSDNGPAEAVIPGSPVLLESAHEDSYVPPTLDGGDSYAHASSQDPSDDTVIEDPALSIGTDGTDLHEDSPTLTSPMNTGGLHPGPAKRFVSSANINKKFLQKTSSSPAPVPVTGKGNTPTVVRPTVVTPQSQSRLVTTKLTMVAPVIANAAAGWKTGAASSGTATPQPPPVPATAQLSTQPPASSSSIPLGVPGAPSTAVPIPSKLSAMGPLVLKPIPTPMSAAQVIPSPSVQPPAMGRGIGITVKRPVAPTNAWGQVPTGSALAGVRANAQVASDFPTAAEAAKGRRQKSLATQQKAEVAAAVQDAMRETADAFRGVHLDPNASHWDEMEDEDNDFLAGEVEFGDGRQYKVGVVETVAAEVPPPPAVPVTKGERFADDFDRSWPRSAPPQQQQQPVREIPPVAPAPPPAAAAAARLSPTDGARAIFNERSNRLEPWARAPYASAAQGGPSFGRRRDTGDEPLSHLSAGRDPPPHSNVHLLQKGGRDAYPPARERQPPSERDRMDLAPPPRDVDYSRQVNGFSNPGSRPGPNGDLSTGRQPPPHLSQLQSPVFPATLTRPPVPAGQGSAESVAAVPRALPQYPPFVSPRVPPTPMAVAPVSMESTSPAAPAPPVVDLQEMHRTEMHLAAERAKKRRQEEEETRERERERAKKKAQEMEEKIKAAEKAKAEEREQERERERQMELAKADERRLQEEGMKAAAVPREVVVSPTPVVVREASKLAARQPQPPPQPRPPQPSRPPSLRPTDGIPAHAPGSQPQPTTAVPSPSERASSWRVSKPPPVVTEEAKLSLPPPSTLHSSSPLLPAQQASSAPVDLSLSARPTTSPIVVTVPEVLSIGTFEDVEEIDFADLRRFVGESAEEKREPKGLAAPSQASSGSTLSSAHALARFSTSDIPPVRPFNNDTRPWRRPSLEVQSIEYDHRLSLASTESAASFKQDIASSQPKTPQFNVTLPTSVDQHGFAAPSVPQTPGKPAKSTGPPQPKFREATLSTLEDTMSKIKGVLDTIHAAPDKTQNDKAAVHSASTQAQQVPPAAATVARKVEVVTHLDRPLSPPPAWRSFAVRVPKVSMKQEAVSPLRLQGFVQAPPPASSDILCWIPPIKNMSARTLSRDDIFFPKTYNRGIVNARVQLPQHPFMPFQKASTTAIVRLPSSAASRYDSSLAAADSSVVASAVPRVLLPKSKVTVLLPRDVPAGVRIRFAEELARRPIANSVTLDSFVPDGLKLVSRSPPPELFGPMADPIYEPPSVVRTPSVSEAQRVPVAPVRGRAPPRMPEGVNLVLYKSKTSDLPSEGLSVNFTVSSELEASSTPTDGFNDLHRRASEAPGDIRDIRLDLPRGLPSIEERRATVATMELLGDSALQITDAASTRSSEESGSSLLSTVVAATTAPTSIGSPQLGSSKTVAQIPTTKSSAPSASITPNPWGKTLLPDPEHLKAVWSQPPGAATTTENSLKGISDEFPASLPVSVQELRSEDVDVPTVKTVDELPAARLLTPPPTVSESAARPRPYIDAHKSFQQVPVQPVGSRFVPPPPVNYSMSNLHPSQQYASLNANATTRPSPGQSTSSASMRAFPSYPPLVPGHSPSPPMMFAPAGAYGIMLPSQNMGGAMSSPVHAHQRVWMPQGATPGPYMGAPGSAYPSMMPYNPAGGAAVVGRPYSHLSTTSKAPGGAIGDRSMLGPQLQNSGLPLPTHLPGNQASPSYHPMGHMEQLSAYPTPGHASMTTSHLGFPPQVQGNSQPIYAAPVGAGRGAVRSGYEAYQPVPPGAFVRPPGW